MSSHAKKKKKKNPERENANTKGSATFTPCAHVPLSPRARAPLGCPAELLRHLLPHGISPGRGRTSEGEGRRVMLAATMMKVQRSRK